MRGISAHFVTPHPDRQRAALSYRQFPKQQNVALTQEYFHSVVSV
jgi:hypothetical protein